MAFVAVLCPCCKKDKVIKQGKTSDGKQRYRCTDLNCPRQTFILDYSNLGCLPEVKYQIIEMAMNGSGIRDTARVLNISPVTVINALKKKRIQSRTG
jgi:transposase-like protein